MLVIVLLFLLHCILGTCLSWYAFQLQKTSTQICFSFHLLRHSVHDMMTYVLTNHYVPISDNDHNDDDWQS